MKYRNILSFNAFIWCLTIGLSAVIFFGVRPAAKPFIPQYSFIGIRADAPVKFSDLDNVGEYVHSVTGCTVFFEIFLQYGDGQKLDRFYSFCNNESETYQIQYIAEPSKEPFIIYEKISKREPSNNKQMTPDTFPLASPVVQGKVLLDTETAPSKPEKRRPRGFYPGQNLR